MGDEKEYLIKGNHTAIAILIRNLVDNAVKYTHNGGTVTISISKNKREVILDVIDNGPGVPQELKKRIFERFFRVVGSKATGSGLGLSIVKQIVDIHNAHIIVKDNPHGKSGLIIEVKFSRVDN